MINRKIKFCDFILPTIIFCAISITLVLFLISKLTGYGKFNLEETFRILTGNYLLDAFLELLITAPCIITLAFSFSLLFPQIFFGKKFGEKLLTYTALCYVLLAFLYIISQFTIPILSFLYKKPFNYIRPSVGASFVACSLSIFSYFFDHNLYIKVFLAIGISIPILLIGLIPLSLEINGISWLHFVD